MTRHAVDDVVSALRRGDLAGARELRFPAGLSEFPREILALADTLEVLDLGAGTLTALPDDLGRLRRLRVLFCSGNRFARLPPVLGDCPALSQIGFRAAGVREVPGESLPPGLRWLTLTDNAIPALPDAIGRLPLLQKLMLAGNRLTELPASLAQADRLELLRLSANGFETLPPWLTALPHLAWLAFAGNPVEPAPAEGDAATVPWGEIACGPLLGEGASGRVHAASWRGTAGTRRVALKLFKGAMTSDGLPAHEMAACLAAGEHPNLAGALGRLTGHPDGLLGLAMPLLPASWRPLAGPPSLASCSRDVYAPDVAPTADRVLRLARDLARAAAHLHGRSLLHGDLYAHNTLWDPATGAAVLSDFGAASRLPPGPMGDALRRVEVRAWGILVSELVDHCADPGALPTELHILMRACLHEDVAARPVMDAVAAGLDAMRPRDG